MYRDRGSSLRTTLLRLFVLALVLLGACACGVMSQELTLYDDKSYAMVTTFTVSESVLAMSGGTAEIERSLDDVVQRAASQGSQVSWRKLKPQKSDEVSYLITARGDTYEVLRADGFVIEDTEFQGRKALGITYDYLSSSLMTLADYRLTIHGDEVLTSNGMQTQRGSVTWHNPMGEMQAILTPKSRLNLGMVLSIGLAAVALLAAFIVVRSVASRRQQKRAALETAQATFCPYCGDQAQPGLRFCMHCGREIPVRE